MGIFGRTDCGHRVGGGLEMKVFLRTSFFTVPSIHGYSFACNIHRVDREDITIIIWDTKLVPDFVLHACYFFIAGNRPVLF